MVQLYKGYHQEKISEDTQDKHGRVGPRRNKLLRSSVKLRKRPKSLQNVQPFHRMYRGIRNQNKHTVLSTGKGHPNQLG